MSTAQKPLSVRCPACLQMAPWYNNPARPFCSARCKDKDFINWADEQHKLVSEDSPLSEQLHSSLPDDY